MDNFKLHLDGMHCNLKTLICHANYALHKVNVRHENVCTDSGCGTGKVPLLPYLGTSTLQLVKATHDVMKGGRWEPVSLSDPGMRRRHLPTGRCSSGPLRTVFILSEFYPLFYSPFYPLIEGNSHSLSPEKPAVFASNYWESGKACIK